MLTDPESGEFIFGEETDENGDPILDDPEFWNNPELAEAALAKSDNLKAKEVELDVRIDLNIVSDLCLSRRLRMS